MSSLFGDCSDEKDIEWIDDQTDYVLKKKRMHKLNGVGGYHSHFNFENADLEFKDDGGEIEIGVSKESWAVTKDDKRFIDRQDLINRGKHGLRRPWRDELPLNMLRELEISDDDETEEFDEDEY